MLWGRTTPMSNRNSLAMPLKLKAHNKLTCGQQGVCSPPGALHMHWKRPHSFFVREHWEPVPSWKKRGCTAPETFLVHQKGLTSCLHFHKERGPAWCQVAMCTDTEIMSWQSAGGKGSQITSFTLLSVGMKDSIYYFGSSQHHSCRWSHVRAAEGRQQKIIIESSEPVDPPHKIPHTRCNGGYLRPQETSVLVPLLSQTAWPWPVTSPLSFPPALGPACLAPKLLRAGIDMLCKPCA